MTQDQGPKRARNAQPSGADSPSVLIQWDDFIRSFTRQWLGVLSPSCWAQTLLIYEQVWRYADCRETVREISAKSLMTGEYAGERKHSGIKVARNTFKANLEEAESHGLLSKTERTDRRYGFRAVTIFEVFPKRVLAGPRAQKLSAADLKKSLSPCAKTEHGRAQKLTEPVRKNCASKQAPHKQAQKAGSNIGAGAPILHEKGEASPLSSLRSPDGAQLSPAENHALDLEIQRLNRAALASLGDVRPRPKVARTPEILSLIARLRPHFRALWLAQAAETAAEAVQHYQDYGALCGRPVNVERFLLERFKNAWGHEADDPAQAASFNFPLSDPALAA